MKPFTDLGALVEKRWRDQNYSEDQFPAVAAQSLLDLNLSERVDPWEVIRWAQTTPNLPEQMDLEANFGDPPVTVYVGPRFYIDVYFWLDGTTSIHQHAFAGAFQVLLGSSVHSSYSFKKERDINAHFLTGRIALNNVSLLHRGDIREINPGPAFIHSLFHLERPSATITIRNYKSPGAAVQFSYLKPFLAYNPFFTDAFLKRRIQTVELLLKMKHPDADSFIGAVLDTSDFQTAYLILKRAFQFLCHRELEEAMGLSRSSDRFHSLLERARSKHGELADLLQPVYEEEWRQDEIVQRRATVKQEDHRFFLALLLNVPDREMVIRLIEEKFRGKDPVDLAVNWLKELAATKVFGSREPNVLGVEFDERHLFVFRGLLTGLSVDEMKAQAMAEAVTLDSPVEEIANHIKALPLFKAMFSQNHLR
jgi:hypothetical protein